MKIFKTLLCVLIVAASLAFCATSAKAFIGTVTNYSTLTFSGTIITDSSSPIPGGGYKSVLEREKCVTKDLLNILTNMDFANSSFPAGTRDGMAMFWWWIAPEPM